MDQTDIKIPWWKRLLSYLMEVHIEEVSSPHNPLLCVSLINGQFVLSTENAVYSYGEKYDNFGKVFEELDMSDFESCLVLGLGLGSIPLMLERKEGYQMTYTGVEIDESVTYLASKYILSKITSPIDIYTGDALTYVYTAEKKFDLICMDVFKSDYIPPEMESEGFLRAMDALLHPGGILLYNRLYYSEKDIVRTNFFLDHVFKKLFPRSTSKKIKGNLMLIHRKSR